MLTRKDIENIQALKKNGYSRRRTAIELKLNPNTVARYWGESVKSRRLEDYFLWGRCPHCQLEYPRPKFFPSWKCPGCKTERSWKECWY